MQLNLNVVNKDPRKEACNTLGKPSRAFSKLRSPRDFNESEFLKLEGNEITIEKISAVEIRKKEKLRKKNMSQTFTNYFVE